jgi:hypothetical protein
MRFPRWAGLLVLAVLAFWLGRGSSELSAQPLLPDGVFVRDSGGGIWLVIGGQRAQVPFLPATDEAIFSVPDSGSWVVQGAGGILTLGPQPGYVTAPPVMAGQATATPTATPAADPPPTVSIQVDDDRIQAGQSVNITVIADDNKGIDWIEWEGINDESDNGNDNQQTGDPELDGDHRFDCDGRTQCANVWRISPKTAGDFQLRARARDNEGNRSEWVSIEFRVR